MADKHPYISGSGPIVKAVQQLRRSLPPTIDSGTIKKLGLAANNETYLINIIRFLGIVDDEGKPSDEAKKVFTQNDDKRFEEMFSGMVKKAYHELFKLHGDAAWKLDQPTLVTFFRGNDQTSAVVGLRQATTFLALAGLCGHQEIPQARAPRVLKGKEAVAKPAPKAQKAKSGGAPPTGSESSRGGVGGVGLTVRIEVNLPAGGDQATYDRIFKSIRENLLNG